MSNNPPTNESGQGDSPYEGRKQGRKNWVAEFRLVLAAGILAALGFLGLLGSYTRADWPHQMSLVSCSLIFLGVALLYWQGNGWEKLSWAGLLVLALALFGASIFEAAGERFWLTLLAVIAVATGSLYLALNVTGSIDSADVLAMRLKGPGKDGSAERKKWTEVQTKVAIRINTGLVTAVVIALFLYVSNHLVIDVTNRQVQWESFRNDSQTYITAEDDTLLSVATRMNTDPARLAQLNPNILVEVPMLADTMGSRQAAFTAPSAEVQGTGSAPAADVEAEERQATEAESTDGAPAAAPEVGAEAPAAPEAADTSPPAAAGATAPLQSAAVEDAPLALQQIAAAASQTPVQAALTYATARLTPGQIVALPISGPRHWLDWLLWCLIGAAVYLFIEHVRFYREIPKGGGDFVNEQYWYLAQLLTGPLIAFVVLQFLTRINLELLGSGADPVISVDFSQLPMDLLFAVSFLLGYFSRVTRKLLERIARAIFGATWYEAQGEFEVVIKDLNPADNVIGAGQTVVFETKPMVANLTWQASAGIMDRNLYKAPEKLDRPESVMVTATALDGSGLSASRAFQVVPEKFTVAVDGETILSAETETASTLHFVPKSLLPEDITDNEIAWEFENSKDVPGVELEPRTGKTTTVSTKPGNEPKPKECAFVVVTTFRGYQYRTQFEVR